MDPFAFERLAHARLSEDPGGAYDALAPLVLGGDPRGDAILRAVERAARDLTCDEELRSDPHEPVLRIDPRWGELCAKLDDAYRARPSGSPTRDLALWQVAEAIAWTHRAPEWVPTCDLPEGDPVAFPYPLLVVGIARRWPQDPRAEDARVLPAGLSCILHQFGGVTCGGASWTGFVLAPPPGLRDAMSDLAYDLANGYGDVIDPTALEALTSRTGALLPGVRWTYGEEAIVTADGWDATAALHGLDVLTFTPREEKWRFLLTWNEEGMRVDRVGRFGAAHEEALRSLTRGGLALAREWQIALVWANSD